MLSAHLNNLLQAQQPSDFGRLGQHLPYAWVEQAVHATGMARLRHRRLPAEQVVWLVTALALYRHQSISEIVDDLDLALLRLGCFTSLRMPGASKIRPAMGEFWEARAIRTIDSRGRERVLLTSFIRGRIFVQQDSGLLACEVLCSKPMQWVQSFERPSGIHPACTRTFASLIRSDCVPTRFDTACLLSVSITKRCSLRFARSVL